MNKSKQQLFDKLGINKSDFLGSGGEGEAYKYHLDKVVKICKGNISSNLEQRKSFYDQLQKYSFSFKTPTIITFNEYRGFTYSIEKQLPGEPGHTVFRKLSQPHRQKLMQNMLAMTAELSQVKPTDRQYGKLIGKNLIQNKSWRKVLTTIVNQTLTKAQKYRDNDIKNLETIVAKFHQEVEIIPDTPTKTLVHGDIFLENILVNKDTLKVTSLLDFSDLSFVGDQLADLAGLAYFLIVSDGVKPSDQQYLIDLVYSTLSQKEIKLVEMYTKYNALIFVNTMKDHPRTYKWSSDTLNRFYPIERINKNNKINLDK